MGRWRIGKAFLEKFVSTFVTVAFNSAEEHTFSHPVVQDEKSSCTYLRTCLGDALGALYSILDD